MAEIENKTLWMRPVDWNIILALLKLIFDNNGKLHPIELENLALSNNVFLSYKSGKPLAHSPRFYYRKVIENLEFVRKINGCYFISDDLSMKLLQPDLNLNNGKKKYIAESIIGNITCQKYFIDLFSNVNNYDLSLLQKKSTYIIAKSSQHIINENRSNAKRKLKPIILTSLVNNRIELDTPDKIQAVFWGVRRWLLDLEILDEIIISFEQGRLIYIVNPDINDEMLKKALFCFLNNKSNDDNDWMTLSITDFYQHIICKTGIRASINAVKKFLIDFIEKNLSRIIPIPISGTMINSMIQFEKQEMVFKKMFLYFSNIGYIAHLRINKRLLEEESKND